jgi:hypothetical protein
MLIPFDALSVLASTVSARRVSQTIESWVTASTTIGSFFRRASKRAVAETRSDTQRTADMMFTLLDIIITQFDCFESCLDSFASKLVVAGASHPGHLGRNASFDEKSLRAKTIWNGQNVSIRNYNCAKVFCTDWRRG